MSTHTWHQSTQGWIQNISREQQWSHERTSRTPGNVISTSMWQEKSSRVCSIRCSSSRCWRTVWRKTRSMESTFRGFGLQTHATLDGAIWQGDKINTTACKGRMFRGIQPEPPSLRYFWSIEGYIQLSYNAKYCGRHSRYSSRRFSKLKCAYNKKKKSKHGKKGLQAPKCGTTFRHSLVTHILI